MNDFDFEDTQLKSQLLIEEDFFLGHPDKLVFAMKEFLADLEPDNLYKQANPLLVSKLDIKSVNNYNFPRISQKDLAKALGNGQKDNNEIVAKMIEMAKTSVARASIEFKAEVANNSDSEEDP